MFNGSGTLTDRILNGPDANQVLADENSAGTVSWLLPDNLGPIRDVAQYNSGTDATTVVDHLKYDSFGNITSQTNSANVPLFTYTGMMQDTTTGLDYDHARWYDPHDGRFISQDPSGFAAGDINLYRYVGNDPTNFTDPTGLAERMVTPDNPDSMPWIKSKLPQTGGIVVGQTFVYEVISSKLIRDPVTGIITVVYTICTFRHFLITDGYGHCGGHSRETSQNGSPTAKCRVLFHGW